MNIQQIKLIVWDLDETFWRGTISEGEVDLIEKNVQFLKKTTDMGIVHSICSKNSYDIVMERLVEVGLWDYFIFPSVSWEAKGARIKELIETVGVRSVNVLFVDDNVQNLEEAKYFCPDMLIAHPDALSELYAQAECAESVDKEHKRLAQYKVLERKKVARKESLSNEDFLFSCDIRVSICENCRDVIDRISDLILRSNQLNYTKNRQTKNELLALIEAPDVKTGYVSAVDIYGDYGIIGFFAVKDHELIHYTFSCRTLGMKIEQYVYYELGCPALTVVGEVASELNRTEKPAWINHITEGKKPQGQKKTVNKRILLKGPCDMSQIFSFICKNDNIKTEFSYTNDQGILIEGHNHTSQLVTALFLDEKRKAELLSAAPFFDSKQFDTALTMECFDFVVLSMLTDGNLGLYLTKDGGESVALCEKYYDLTNSKNRDLYINKKVFTSNISFKEGDLDSFAEHFSYVSNNGDITVNNLEVIRHKLNVNTKLVLLLGSEREFKKKGAVSYVNRHIEHREMNDKIRTWAKNYDNVILMPFDNYIKGDSDFLDTINHFVKSVYYALACDLVKLFNSDIETGILVKGRWSLFLAEVIRILKKIKRYFKL